MNSQSRSARFNSEVSYMNDVEALNRDRENTNLQHDQRPPPRIRVLIIFKEISNIFIGGWEQYEEYIHQWTNKELKKAESILTKEQKVIEKEKEQSKSVKRVKIEGNLTESNDLFHLVDKAVNELLNDIDAEQFASTFSKSMSIFKGEEESKSKHKKMRYIWGCWSE